MEIIFTLILLIGFGINSHRIEFKKQELPKEQITVSTIQETETKVPLKKEVRNRKYIYSNNESSEIISTNKVISKAPATGKYISIRISDT